MTNENKNNSASFRVILTTLGLCVLLCLDVFFFSGCNNKGSKEMTQHYERQDIKLATTIDKTTIYLPQFITINLSADLPENREIQVSINKKSKQYFKLENASIQKHSASVPERIIMNYTYVLSPEKTGTFYLPGFDVTTYEGSDTSNFATDSIFITILSLLPQTAAQDSVSMRPISNRISSGSVVNSVWWILLILGGLIYWFSRKFIVNPEKQEVNPPGIQDHLAEIKQLKKLNLDAQSFDVKINSILQKILQQSDFQYDQKITFKQQWQKIYTRQSYGQKQAETTRQAQLTAFIIKKFSR